MRGAEGRDKGMKSIATWIEKDKGKHFEELFDGSDYRLLNARVDEVFWDEVDGLLLTGGCDISPQWLEQPVPDPSLVKNPDEARDAWDFEALRHALGGRLPILAICRGQQVLNVVLGGTLQLDIPGHNVPEQKYGNVQELHFASCATVRIPRVNSSHHQAIAELGNGLEVEAWHAGDNTIEQVRLRDYPFCLGVQYHPERDKIYQPLFDAFFDHIK
jgi:putative glutamine amidotransferase